ncbi:DUF2120 family protein [Methanobrevibacter filiformis]|uniref:Uncharacterized protein n=1 Tax=Methanobrevibacter filiformis TaxID=55758 RepID=A0A166BQT8_9EURY|nr:DUF2120 family protein [Methanobrevibacter filiformis]KZX13694.1 hypothetical protein MBFIL_09900 [Methanobrevibacter filiformis]
MVKLHKIAGQIVKFLDAFEGSRAALDAQLILIIRARSSKNIKIDELEEKLEKLIEHMEGHEIPEISDDAGKLINRMDEQIRSSMQINGETDIGGVSRMKKSFEALNVAVEYKFFEIPTAGIFVAIWKDKADVGPVYIEFVVSDNET